MWLIKVSLLLSVLSIAHCSQCNLPLPRFRFFAPLIFSPNGKLLTTDSTDEHSHSIQVPGNDHVVLSCAPNYFKHAELNSTKFTRATCKSGKLFEVNGVERDWTHDLSCEVRAVEEIITSTPSCSGTSVEFGYANPITEETLVLGAACYSEVEGRTLFIHTRKDDSQNDALKTEKVNYLAQRHPSSRYKVDMLVAATLDELEIRLKQKLQTKTVPFFEMRHFIDLPTLSNGQLYSSLKLGWNFFVANGFDHMPNFDLLHRDIATQKNYDLYMGTHGILSLQNAQNQPVDAYLLPDEKKYPIPKYVWLVIKTDTRKAAAFLILNDIKATEDDVTDAEPCESKCEQMQWLTNLLNGNAFNNVKNGYVWCCDLESFARKVPEMPAISGKHELLL